MSHGPFELIVSETSILELQGLFNEFFLGFPCGTVSSAVMHELLKQPALAIRLCGQRCVWVVAQCSQPVWHREVVLSFTVVASFCQCCVCQTILMQSLSLLNKGELGE